MIEETCTEYTHVLRRACQPSVVDRVLKNQFLETLKSKIIVDETELGQPFIGRTVIFVDICNWIPCLTESDQTQAYPQISSPMVLLHSTLLIYISILVNMLTQLVGMKCRVIQEDIHRFLGKVPNLTTLGHVESIALYVGTSANRIKGVFFAA